MRQSILSLGVVFTVLSVLIVLAVGGYIAYRSLYYRRMFSEGNFRAFHNGLSRAVMVAKGKGANGEPSREDGSAFVTDAGLAVGVTFSPDEDGTHMLHISLSQPGSFTTHSVCSRFGFFAAAMLRENKAYLMPYYTESGVHHLVFWFQSRDLNVQGFDIAHSVFLDEYKPIPFEYQEIESEPPPAADG